MLARRPAFAIGDSDAIYESTPLYTPRSREVNRSNTANRIRRMGHSETLLERQSGLGLR